ncbi:MAG: prepilin peptidase [Gammaproteobacteria bacterium]|tara:strand:+ start:760 stop:1509 length:750 start_codon:yes stop_codon:yes gene_type:complete
MEILYAFLLGLIFGSFLNSLSYRMPIILNYHDDLKEFPDMGLSFPRSFCPNCKAPLSLFSLIPVLSFFIQLGKCKSCKKSISISYPFFEILLGILFALILIKAGSINYIFLLNCLFIFTLILIARLDESFFKIPFSLNLIVFFTGILTNFYFTSLGLGFVSFLICFAVLSAIKFLADYILKKDSFGWGDIILISNLSLFFGINNLPFILFVSSLSGIIWYFFKKRNTLEKTIAFGSHIALSGIWLLFIL